MHRFRFISSLLLIALAACVTAASRQSPAPIQPPIAGKNATQSRIIPVTAELWKFTPNVIRAKQGKKVTLQISGISGTHGFYAPALGINVTVIQGHTVNVVIPTDKPGTFNFRCSVPCGVGHQDMKGKIVIEP